MNNWGLSFRHEERLTVRSPDEPNGEEVLQVIEQSIFDLEVFLYPDGARTAGGHDKPRAIQADAGEPGEMERDKKIPRC